MIFHSNVTLTVQVISPLMPWRQDPLLVISLDVFILQQLYPIYLRGYAAVIAVKY